MKLPKGFESWNRSLQGAYRKGYAHASGGGSALGCPYLDRRKKDGRLTWSRAYVKAWNDGFADYHYPTID